MRLTTQTSNSHNVLTSVRMHKIARIQSSLIYTAITAIPLLISLSIFSRKRCSTNTEIGTLLVTVSFTAVSVFETTHFCTNVLVVHMSG